MSENESGDLQRASTDDRSGSGDGSTVTRRTAMRTMAGAAVAAGAAGAVPAAAAQSGPDYGGWFDGVGNFDGTVDMTGEDSVTVTVGAQGNGGAFAFDPAAVRVDPGTTVTWEWSGDGGSHNVVAEDGSFESELVGDAGHTFEQDFEEEGVYRYVCSPHRTMGMKGAVVVGGSGGSGGESVGSAASGEGGAGAGGSGIDATTGLVGGSFLLALFSPLAFAAFLRRRLSGRRGPRPE
uniref:halocyanin domain-containing protein n=1 Tax=Halomicrobium urmianum TaxID=1586233 RepID=UPI001CD9B512|nr:halocyanin domain-containing protein [Halomicrobium urmianum]